MPRCHLRLNPVIMYLFALSFYSAFQFVIHLQNDRDSQMLEEDHHLKEMSNGDFSRNKIVNNRHNGEDGEVMIESVEHFFNLLNQAETHCKKLIEIGGSSCGKAVDHSKLLCLDEDVSIKPYNCTVYSFGIGEDITFDKEMQNYGCDVFMFDPSIPRTMVSEYLNEKLKFHQLGISNDTFKRNFQWHYKDGGPPSEVVHGVLDTFSGIQNRIGHENKPVHYLKMDIDSFEWRVIPDLIRNNHFKGVNQFAIEIHTTDLLKLSKAEGVRYLQNIWNILRLLHDHGFLRASYKPNVVLESLYWIPGRKEPIATCGELLYLKRNIS